MKLPTHVLIALILFCFVSAAAQNGNSPSQYELWGEMLRRENYRAVISETTAELARNPQNIVALRMRAQAYGNVDWIPQARQDLALIAQALTNPATAEDYEMLCYAYRATDKFSKDEGIARCTKAIELNPQNIFGYYNRGQAYQATKDYDKSIADMTRVIELDPKYANAYRFRGDAHNYRDEFKQAFDDYGKAIALNPKNSLFYVGRGYASLHLENYTEAIADLTKATELDSKNASPYIYLGNARAGLNEFNQSLVAYDKAIGLDPKNASAYHGRGIAYRHLFNRNSAARRYYTAALRDLSKAIELEPTQGQVYVERAKVYGFNEEFKPAIADLTKAIELNEGNVEAYCIRHSLYEYMGQKKLADADLTRAGASECRKFKTKHRPGDTY